MESNYYLNTLNNIVRDYNNDELDINTLDRIPITPLEKIKENIKKLDAIDNYFKKNPETARFRVLNCPLLKKQFEYEIKKITLCKRGLQDNLKKLKDNNRERALEIIEQKKQLKWMEMEEPDKAKMYHDKLGKAWKKCFNEHKSLLNWHEVQQRFCDHKIKTATQLLNGKKDKNIMDIYNELLDESMQTHWEVMGQAEIELHSQKVICDYKYFKTYLDAIPNKWTKRAGKNKNKH